MRSVFFSSKCSLFHNGNLFGSCMIHILYTVCAKIKKIITPLDYYIWGHMKTLVYETKVDSRAALHDRIFAVAEQIRNHLDTIASAIQSLLVRAENCLASGGGHFEQLL